MGFPPNSITVEAAKKTITRQLFPPSTSCHGIVELDVTQRRSRRVVSCRIRDPLVCDDNSSGFRCRKHGFGFGKLPTVTSRLCWRADTSSSTVSLSRTRTMGIITLERLLYSNSSSPCTTVAFVFVSCKSSGCVPSFERFYFFREIPSRHFRMLPFSGTSKCCPQQNAE